MTDKNRAELYSQGFPDSISCFQSLADPRTGNAKLHYFGELIFIALCSIITLGEGFDDMERFAKEKESWLRKHLILPGGIPSDDTFRRLFTALDPKAFNACFIQYVKHLLGGELPKQLIAIDGKTVRHSFDNGDPSSSIHLISAWASTSQITLAQLEIGEKTNEIPEIPKLLEMLDLKGNTVSLDAMGCQKAIAQAIHFAEANYLLALKGNHGTLHQEVTDFFADPATWSNLKKSGSTFSSHCSEDGGHGRIEKRTVLVTDAIDWIEESERKHWVGLKSLVLIESERTSSGKTSIERRYFLTSHEPNAEVIAPLIRGHWGIENQCHWVLDVVWREDESRIRKENAPQNVALLRKIAMNLIKLNTRTRDSIKGIRYRASLNDSILESILGLANS